MKITYFVVSNETKIRKIIEISNFYYYIVVLFSIFMAKTSKRIPKEKINEKCAVCVKMKINDIKQIKKKC